MNSLKVREKFLQFFKDRGHEVQAGSSLSGTGDPSLLFVNAGMNPFKDVFLGLKEAPAKNVVTIQRCLRAGGKHNDLEMVGETPLHHTFFEMLGNFSFGGYFKEKAIALAWEFLTQELALDKDNLWITVHKKDEESYQIWRDQEKIPEHKIYRMGDEDNFWRMGETGPCGYCSEIHYYAGNEKRPDPSQFMEIWNLVFTEFNQLRDGKKERLSRPCVDTGMGLERICAVLQGKSNNYETDLFRDIILDLEKASGLKYDFEQTVSQSEKQKAFRVLADHSRAVTFLIHEALLPGSSGAEYVLRRIMRRAFYYGWKLNKQQNLLGVGVRKLIETLSSPSIDLSSKAFSAKYLGYSPDLKKDEPEIQSCIKSEAGQFLAIIEEGEKEWEKLKKSKESKKSLTAKEIWNLYSTYGLPIELSQLKFKDWAWQVATDEEIKQHRELIAKDLSQGLYDVRKEEIKQKALASLNSKESCHAQETCHASRSGHPKEQKTQWTAYKKRKEEGQILGLAFIPQAHPLGQARQHRHALSDPHADQPPHAHEPRHARQPRHARESGHPSEASPVETFSKNPISSFNDPLTDRAKGYIIMDKTCFYPEGGGPVGDKGWLFRANTKEPLALVLDCQKIGETVLHEVEFIAPKEWEQKTESYPDKESQLNRQLRPIKRGEKIFMVVNKDFREGIKSAHTSTHLLNSALREILSSSSVRQAGSLVEPYRLRFDFTHPRPLTKIEISQIEEKLRQKILSQEDLKAEIKNFDQAEQEGALFLKAEKKYGKEVRVISIGDKSSKELCGGIHVQNTREIEAFKIISETGVQSGVRRITAYTGLLAKAFEKLLIQENLSLRKQIGFSKVEDSFLTKNPFLKYLENHKEELKTIRKKIIRLEEGSSKHPKIDKASNEIQNLKLENQDKTKKRSDILNSKTKKGSNKIAFDPLANQMLELREYLKISLPKEKNAESFWHEQIQSKISLKSHKENLIQNKEVKNPDSINFLFFFLEYSASLKHQDLLKKRGAYQSDTQTQNLTLLKTEDNLSPVLKLFKERETKLHELKNQWKKIQSHDLTKEKLLTRAKEFRFQKTQGQEIKGKLLTVKMPLNDRKILSDLSDSLLSAVAPGVLILLGEGETKAPLLVNITKDLTKTLSANDILKKTILPLCKGQGGGRPHFAQGSISQPSAFPKVEPTLLEQWKTL